jgi:prefoldin subunit 5
MVSQRELAQVVDQVNAEFSKLRQELTQLKRLLQECQQGQVMPDSKQSPTTKVIKKQEKD